MNTRNTRPMQFNAQPHNSNTNHNLNQPNNLTSKYNSNQSNNTNTNYESNETNNNQQINDFNTLFENFSGLMNGQQIPDNVKSMLGSMLNNNANNNANNNSNTNPRNNNMDNNKDDFNSNSSNDRNSFNNIDLNTIFKIQNLMNSINNDKENEYRTNLLLSLKPYLKKSRKEKIDQYIQLMKMEKIFETINPLSNSSNNNHEKNK